MSRYGELDLGDLGPAPSVDDWWDERRHQDPALSALALDDAPLVALVEPDPREDWGTLDAGGRAGGGRAGGAETEVVRARVALVSSRLTGIQLVGYGEEWINTSNWRPVDLSGVQAGDEVEAEVTRAGNGRLYLERLEVLQQRPPYRDGEP
jgi:hypothetical protein